MPIFLTALFTSIFWIGFFAALLIIAYKSRNRHRLKLSDFETGDTISYFHENSASRIIQNIVESNDPVARTICIKEEWQKSPTTWQVYRYSDARFKDLHLLNTAVKKDLPEILASEITKAEKKEDFERAAKLRDAIKILE